MRWSRVEFFSSLSPLLSPTSAPVRRRKRGVLLFSSSRSSDPVPDAFVRPREPLLGRVPEPETRGAGRKRETGGGEERGMKSFFFLFSLLLRSSFDSPSFSLFSSPPPASGSFSRLGRGARGSFLRPERFGRAVGGASSGPSSAREAFEAKKAERREKLMRLSPSSSVSFGGGGEREERKKFHRPRCFPRTSRSLFLSSIATSNTPQAR